MPLRLPVCRNIYQLAAVLGVCFSFAAITAANAGDLLRGGAPAGAVPGGRQAGARGASAAAARARASSNDALSRTTMALQSMKSMQAAARAIAKRGPTNLGINPNAPGQQLPNVPNGLVPGGLQVSPGVPATLPDNGIPGLWFGAGLPTQRVVDGQTIVTIQQEESKALLTWETFNIGEDTTLKFDQSAGGEDKGKWTVFNKVEDPTGVPSQILGSIKAAGQVYVINRNGIIFGGSSQINTRGFVASTLPINDNLLGQGLLNNPDAQFLFSALSVPGGADGTPAFFPTTIDPEFTLSEGTTSYTLAESLAAGSPNRPRFTYRALDGITTALVENVDYTLSTDLKTATFTADGLAKVANTPIRATYTPEVVKSGNINVQSGAVIQTPVSADGNGGRVMLVGANVTNAGRISTPAGQTVLAAGQQVGVAAHASNDPSLRGLDVWIGAAGDGTGTVTNRGIVESMEGSVLMHGKAVNQLGAIESSTSVNLNGRIDLRASYGAVSNPNYDNPSASPSVGGGGPIFMYQHTGVVELGENSVTRILPDYLSPDTAPGMSLPEASQINAEGRVVHFRSNALLLAPSGDVNLRAGAWPYVDANGDRTILGVGESGDPGVGNLLFAGGEQKFLFAGGQVYMDSTSMISVAGSTEVFVPLAESILDVEFRGAELADSPLQRNGLLQTNLLTLDLRLTGIYGGRYWIGTPLGDATGLAGLIQRNVAQLTADGGTVKVRAGESIVVQEGATIDVSGGYYDHEGGLVKTSRLLQYGRLVDVADAVPNSLYDGIFTGQFARVSARWGIMDTFAVPWMTGAHYEEGYIAGANGGTLDLTAPSMAVDGELLGKTVQGPRQRSAPPVLSSLSISFKAERLEPLLTDSFLTVSPTPPTITFQDAPLPEVLPFDLTEFQEPLPIREERLEKFNISPDIFGENGFGRLAVENTDGHINLPEGIRVAIPARGSLALKGANITILGQVSAPAGQLSFTTYNLSPEAVALFNAQGGSTLPPPPPNEDRGLFTLGAKAALTTAGLVVNDLPGSRDPMGLPLAIDGGSISIQTYSASLAQGSTIDVSGGVAVSAAKAITYGEGGDILIRTGRDVTLSRAVGGRLSLGSALLGYSGTTGGTLSLQASTIQIGGSTADADTLLLAPEFFRHGGFTSYSLTGIGTPEIPGLSIAPGTTLRPVAENWMATVIPGTQEVLLEPKLNELGYRSPASLSLTASGYDDSSTGAVYEVVGNLVIPQDVRIFTDPGAKVSLQGNTVTVLGSILVPGGTITISGSDRYPVGGTVVPEFAQSTVYIGPDALLSTAGTAVVVPDEFGRRVGTVYSGGAISVSGNIIAEAGAVLDVSGSSGTFDLQPTSLGIGGSPIVPAGSGVTQPLWKLQSIPTRLDSDGGFIDLTGSEMLFTDATLLGSAGGPTARGGTLSVASNRFAEGDATSADINLLVTATGRTISANNTDLGVGSVVLDEAGEQAAGMGYFSVSRFNKGGFDSLDLGFKYFATAQPGIGGNVQFEGPVTISARGALRIAAGGIVKADAPVTLQAGYVAIGQEFQPPLNPEDPVDPLFPTLVGSAGGLAVAPTFGPGVLRVNAGVIDLGTVSLQGIGEATLTAAGGDIRGNGSFNIAGDLTLRAAQVYPTTLSTLNIFAYDHEGTAGSVTILRSGQAQAPLSAGGTLNILATDITQGGVLRAPMGSITLGWDGTDLDPSDPDLDTPFDQITQGSIAVPVSSQVTLKSHSLTSVSGAGLLVPFGLSPDGSTWIDPSGVNVTVSGLPEKEVVIAGNNVVKQGGSVVDLRGGGDLYAFRWIPGPGGSADILGAATAEWSTGAEYEAGDLVLFGGQTWTARISHSGETPSIGMFWTLVPESFAILPRYQSALAPYAPFNQSTTLGGEAGFVSNHLTAGDQIFVDGVAGLAAGTYTLLPSRYALLPGAFLVTPTGNEPIGSVTLADGAGYTSGVTFNTFSHGSGLSPVLSQFEVAPYDVVHNRVQFDNYAGNAFFTDAAARLNVAERQELPMDGGYLSLHGNAGLEIAGSVLTGHVSFARGASIDISSFADIEVIGGSTTAPAGSRVVLNTSVLNSWGAESVLIGGIRRDTEDGTAVEVRAGNVELNNLGSTLVGSDIALAATTELTIAEGSSVATTGRLHGGDPLVVSGNGALVRVSADPGAVIVRENRSESPAVTPLLSIGAGAQLSGGSVIFDSTHDTQLDSNVTLNTRSLTLGSGRISLQLPGSTADLANSGSVVISGQILQDAAQVRSLTLTSYSTIDIYGAGEFGSDSLRNLTFQSTGITRGESGPGTGDAFIRAQNISFANQSDVTQPTALQVNAPGTLQIEADVIRFGENAFSVGGYENVVLNATGGMLARAEGNGTAEVPTFSVAGNLTMNAPVITGIGGATQEFAAGGMLVLGQTGADATVHGGLGSSLSFTGAGVVANGNVVLPSGEVTLRATSGDLTVGGTLDVSGTRREFFDLIRYSPGGNVTLASDSGNVSLAAGSNVSVSALNKIEDGISGGAGLVRVNASKGVFNFDSGATLNGAAGEDQISGTFVLDAGSLPDFNQLGDALNAGGFFETRNLRVRTGDVLIDGINTARTFAVSADAGAIRVAGTSVIDASGETGGRIALSAHGDLILENGALLTVHATDFSSAGKGGDVYLAAGTASDGIANIGATLDVHAGSTIDLGVDAFRAGGLSDAGSSAFRGNFTGTLHLRAPRTNANSDIGIATLGGTIAGVSSIVAEGYEVMDLTQSGGLITGSRSSATALPSAGTVQRAVYDSAEAFLGTANYDAMIQRLLGSDPQNLLTSFVLAPGVEIINTNGDLTIGAAGSTSLAGDWSLADFRFGPKGAAGVLTLRASGNIVLNNSLSDGFTPVGPTASNGNSTQWLAQMSALNPNLPVNTQSWSYHLAAGSDLSAADYHAVVAADVLASGKGSLLLGEFYPAVPNTTGSAVGSAGTTANTMAIAGGGTRFEVIRTGTGDIDIAAAADVQLRNVFSTIYSAGVRLPNATSIFSTDDFVVPSIPQTAQSHPPQGDLGAIQQPHVPQWSMAGGDVTISAENDIRRVTLLNGELIDDSSRQLPNNWLYRRGYVDPGTGMFGAIRVAGGLIPLNDPAASTTWWIDFTNFFQGVGALGGGDVTLLSGNNIVNVDAVLPTNARMAARDGTGAPIRPDSANLVELGGGDLVVRAANNLDGGIYYVEQGKGLLFAGGDIKTNAARTPSLGILRDTDVITPGIQPDYLDPLTWLPTTLFVGKSSFDVSARGDILLGPVVNPFLLPQGLNNKFWYKTYFNTYSDDAGATVASFGGDVTHRYTTSNGSVLQVWLETQNRLIPNQTSPSTAGHFQPWIRLAESSPSFFQTLLNVNGPDLISTAFAGDIHMVGSVTLFPSATGDLELAASGSVVGLNPVGLGSAPGLSGTFNKWASSTINLSDADPGLIPGVATPLSFLQIVPNPNVSILRQTRAEVLAPLNLFFQETGSYSGLAASSKVQQALHTDGLLHAADDQPVRVYAGGGDITGITLFTPKAAQIAANRDITDVSFYIQDVAATDISFVSAGRDIIPYNENAPLRTLANDLEAGNVVLDQFNPLAGDIQINGPGVLEVLAGRNVDLGAGPNFPDGTGFGITSVGNARNPFLPFAGADLVVMAGVSGPGGEGPAFGLTGSSLDFDAFINEYQSDIESTESAYLARLGANVRFEDLSEEQRALVALDTFYVLLRDSGRSVTAAGSPTTEGDPAAADSAAAADPSAPADPAAASPTGASTGYDAGFAAIDTLFGDKTPHGDILTQSREIRTRSGGAISLAAPGGGVIMASDIFGNPLTPPGVVTEFGGAVSILTDGNVEIGQARIFTLRGGDITIWSSNGDIAAGNAPKTVVSAPPTRVIIDVNTATVQTDLGGLATGGGIGVLAAVEGVPAGNVDLIAPNGAVDAGDAGIRVTGNLNIAATTVLNASNIQSGGTSSGVPSAPPAAAPNLGAVSSSSAAAAGAAAANQVAQRGRDNEEERKEEAASIVVVEVIGYGGGEGGTPSSGSTEEDEEKRRKKETEDQQSVEETGVPQSN